MQTQHETNQMRSEFSANKALFETFQVAKKVAQAFNKKSEAKLSDMQSMKEFGWIPADSVAPNRHSESFIDLVQTRLVVFSGLSFGEAMKLTFEIKNFLKTP